MTTPESTNGGYPQMAAAPGRIEPSPRRVRGLVGSRVLFDSVRAHYGWETPYYPQYYVPGADVTESMLVDERRTVDGPFGAARCFGLRKDGQICSAAALRYGRDAPPGIADTYRFDWAAVDMWFEESEQIFVHPRNPYVRVDALRSGRHVRIDLAGAVLAESRAPVLVFETGLPTRYYFDRAAVDVERLRPSRTRSQCPYKGTTTSYWSVEVDGVLHEDLAWSYDFPTRQLLPVAGLIAFYDERVDVCVDGVRQERPRTHFTA